MNPQHLQLFVSTTGSDAANGAFPEPGAAAGEGPLATPRAALEKLRAARQAGHAGPVTVWLRGGVYPLEQPLELGVESSGTAAAAVLWSAWPGETPCLDGGRRITGWQPLETPLPGLPAAAKGQVWVAEVPAGWHFRRLFLDGKDLSRSVSVDADDWHKWPVCQIGANPDAEVVIAAKDLPAPGDGLFADLNFMPTPYTHWANTVVRVRGIDRDAGKILWGPQQITRPDKVGNIPFRLENLAGGLTAPGRWYLDSGSGRLYLWPPAGTGDPNRGIVVAPFLSELLKIDGSRDGAGPVRHLTVRGLEFRHGREEPREQAQVNWDGSSAMLNLGGVEDSAIEDCVFTGFEGWAVAGSQPLRRVAVRRCRISDGGGGGIRLGGRIGAGEPACADNIIEDNHIRNCGRMFWHSSGIRLGVAARTLVAHNLVEDLPYTGIASGGGPRHTYFRGWPRPFPEYEALWREHGEGEPTIDKVKRFIPGHNRIEKNIVRRVMQVLDDGGAIYCHAGHHELVRHNVVHDVAGRCVFGIYFDDEQMDSEMSGNLVYNCPVKDEPKSISTAIHLHHNGRNRVLNNILVGGRQVLSVANGYGGHRIENNILFFTAEPDWNRANPRPSSKGAGDGRRQVDLNAGPPSVCRNLWWHVRGQAEASRLLGHWRKISRNYGAGSRAADPLFTNPAAGDFRVQPESPAFKLGFKPLEIDDAGPRQPDAGKRKAPVP